MLVIGQEPILNIIFEDKSIIVVNKPAGQLFHGRTAGPPSSLVTQIQSYLSKSREKSADTYVGVVHRLDRPTSGLALFACNSKAAGRLGQQFSQREVEKDYLTVVCGQVASPSGTLEDELEVMTGDETRGEDIEASRPEQRKQYCQLRYEVLRTMPQATLLKVRLGTGRRHQIRRQWSLRGHPVVGDALYGATQSFPELKSGDPRFHPIALHAWHLSIKHPLSFERLTFQAPPPAIWQEWTAGTLN